MVVFVDCQFWQMKLIKSLCRLSLRQGERIPVRGFSGQLAKAFGASYLRKEPSPSPLPARERRPTTNLDGFLFTQAGVKFEKAMLNR
jgi:hypothetical protein